VSTPVHTRKCPQNGPAYTKPAYTAGRLARELKMSRRPTIAIAGLACETSTFTPSRTLAPAFHAQRGSEIFEKHAFIRPGTPLGNAADWKGALIGHAMPGGVVTRDAFEELAGEMIQRLGEICAAGPLEYVRYFMKF
jgi:microcystin degradation protein MlrC